MLCKLGFHSWCGCKCKSCGGLRDQDHSWATDCKTCTRCGRTRAEAHDWQGCKCSLCGKTRDQGHNWQGCKCSLCGKTRDQAHKWPRGTCEICGKSQPEAERLQERVNFYRSMPEAYVNGVVPILEKALLHTLDLEERRHYNFELGAIKASRQRGAHELLRSKNGGIKMP